MENNMGARIAELLQESGKTQKELAIMVGVTETAMSRYISGDREPKPETLANIATALKTTSDDLLGIEKKEDEFDAAKITRILSRNAKNLSNQEKKDLINAILSEDWFWN